MARKKIETIDDLTAPLIAQEKNKTRQGQCDIKEGKKARELNATAVNMPKYVITGLDPQLIGGIFVNLGKTSLNLFIYFFNSFMYPRIRSNINTNQHSCFFWHTSVPKSREAQLIFTAEGQQVKIYAGQVSSRFNFECTHYTALNSCVLILCACRQLLAQECRQTV
jgi:hypothetical protein